MRSIAILNQKGGVGKTTTAVNLAAACQRAGQRVLLLDLDPQAHATLHTGVEIGPADATLYDVMVHGTSVAEVARSAGSGLTILPASVDLVGAELQMVDRAQRERVLQSALGPFSSGFDLCIVDCAPSLGLLTVNALVLVQEIVIPLQPHFLALQGLGRLLETVTAVRESLNPRLRVLGVVLSLYERSTRLAQEVREDVQSFFAAAGTEDAWHGARLFDTVIRRNIKLAECPSFGKTIFDYEPGSHGAADYENLAREILGTAAARPDDVTDLRSVHVSEVGLAPDTSPMDRAVPEGIVTAPPGQSPARVRSLPDEPPVDPDNPYAS